MRKGYWLVCGALLSGCVHTGAAELKKELAATAVPVAAKKEGVSQEKPEVSAAMVEHLMVKGKTTKKEILDAFGAPNAVEPNRQRPSQELVAKAKGALPPIAYTKEFYKYWSKPFTRDGNARSKIFNLLVFFDDKDVAVDYMTTETKVAIP